MSEEMTQVWIAPSLLSADVGRLAAEVVRLEEAGADLIHIDVMDGHFVPNLAFNAQSVDAVNRATDLLLEVHLMLYNPHDYVERFIQAGADRVLFHFEATEDVEDTLEYIGRCNGEAGLAFCPQTNAALIPKFVPLCDQILLMTVDPGFGGQQFIASMLDKVRFVREYCTVHHICRRSKTLGMVEEDFLIEVDGGVDGKTASLCIEAGANVLVAGTYLFQSQDMSAAIRQMRTGKGYRL